MMALLDINRAFVLLHESSFRFVNFILSKVDVTITPGAHVSELASMYIILNNINNAMWYFVARSSTLIQMNVTAWKCSMKFHC